MPVNQNEPVNRDISETEQHNSGSAHCTSLDSTQSQDSTKAKESQTVDQQQQLEATSEQLKHDPVDILVQVPYEIMCTILDYLDMESVLNCSNVSRAWRRTILQCERLWRVITIIPIDTIWTTPEKLCQILPSISQHVEQIHIDCDSGDLLVKFLEAFRAYEFSKLWSLSISEGWTRPSDHVSFSQSVYDLLSCVARSLTQLQIRTYHAIDLSFPHVVSICSNLTSIKFDVRRNMSRDYAEVSHSTRLTSISYHVYPTLPLPSSSNFDAVLRLSPNLVSLRLDIGKNISALLPIIAKHCPKLKEFSMCSRYSDFEDAPDYQKMLPGTDGLESFAIGLPSSLTNLPIILESNHDTLKYFRLNIGASDKNISDWQFLASLAMGNLIHFSVCLHDCSSAFRNNLADILRCYPRLQTLKLDEWSTDESGAIHTPPLPVLSSIFDTICGMEHLTHLEFDRMDIRPPSFLTLLHHYASRNTLQRLKIYLCDGLSSLVLQHVSRIRSLVALDISLESMRVPTADATEFIRSLVHLRQLSTLRLSHVKLTIDDAKVIAESMNLQKLEIYKVDILNEAVQVLRRNIKEVEYNPYLSSKFI